MSRLDRKRHVEKLRLAITGPLPKFYQKIVPSQTWTVYWITHSLNLLEQNLLLADLSKEVVAFVKECAHKNGGYGGGPGQIAHLATTYAAVNSLVTIATKESLDSIDRIKLLGFLRRMKKPDGSFSMHDDGEIDSRASYCAMSVLRCLNIEDTTIFKNVAYWVLSCQTYEGGFGSIPGSEAHGGYTFCCVATLCLLNQLHRADIGSLLRWLTSKQLTDDGGFCGRSNKLVDSCYSFWQGATFPLIHPFLKKFIDHNSKNFRKRGKSSSDKSKLNQSSPINRPITRSQSATTASAFASADPGRYSSMDMSDDEELDDILENWIFDCSALQDYVLNQCQAPGGLLRDKPSAVPDFYHTCYALSGISISQHQPSGDTFDLGVHPINILSETHPIFNITPKSLNFCFEHFKNKRIEVYAQTEPGDAI